jgi:hypothetical protein
MVEEKGFGSGAWRWCTGRCTAPNDNRCVVCEGAAFDGQFIQLFVAWPCCIGPEDNRCADCYRFSLDR